MYARQQRYWELVWIAMRYGINSFDLEAACSDAHLDLYETDLAEIEAAVKARYGDYLPPRLRRRYG